MYSSDSSSAQYTGHWTVLFGSRPLLPCAYNQIPPIIIFGTTALPALDVEAQKNDLLLQIDGILHITPLVTAGKKKKHYSHQRKYPSQYEDMDFRIFYFCTIYLLHLCHVATLNKDQNKCRSMFCSCFKMEIYHCNSTGDMFSTIYTLTCCKMKLYSNIRNSR